MKNYEKPEINIREFASDEQLMMAKVYCVSEIILDHVNYGDRKSLTPRSCTFTSKNS